MSYSTSVGHRGTRPKDVRTYSAAAPVQNGYAGRIALSLHDGAAAQNCPGGGEGPIAASILLVTHAYAEALRRAADASPVEAALLEMRHRSGADLDREVVGELLTIIRNDTLANLIRAS